MVHNPRAGDASPAADILLQMLSDAGYRTRYISTDEAWQEALQWPADLVVAVGGDGTVGKVATALVGNEMPFSVLAFGTANNIAKSLGISGDARAAADSWRDARMEPFDVWRVRCGRETTMFVESLGGGFLGEPIADAAALHAPTLIMGGAIDRALHLLREGISRVGDERWEIELDGQDLSDRYIGVEAMSIRSIGPNLPLAPEASPGDGLLDVVLVSAADRDALHHRLRSVATAQTPGQLRLPVRRGRSLTLRPPRGVALHLDGEPWAPAAGLSDAGPIRVDLAGQARVMTPVTE